mgnify:FL=1|tara:strand:- start:1248 stop:1763 length:516 start_codon:yes stop_codon:yes gene_type:complete
MLEILGKRHEEWIAVAVANGCPASLAEDVVQEVYLRLHKYRKAAEHKLIAKDGTVNMFYMWVTIRNQVRTEIGKEDKYIGFQEFYFEEADASADEGFEARYQDLMNDIKEEVDSWGAYNSKLFNLYFKTDLSMRKIAKGTGISLTHIFGSVTRYRETIKEKFTEDFNNLNQ